MTIDVLLDWQQRVIPTQLQKNRPEDEMSAFARLAAKDQQKRIVEMDPIDRLLPDEE